MAEQLEWSRLLNPSRVCDLLDVRQSLRSKDDFRTEFERDWGRVVYSTPLRRLRGKAQVFPLDPHDAVRDRLIHSYEVSSVAEDIATQVVREVIAPQAPASLSEENLKSIPLIAATCGLVHDIGNPPFGHAGELAISTWFEKHVGSSPCFFSSLGGAHSRMAQDLLNFEGNAQSIRAVSHLQILVDQYGLNFTAATLSAAGKYIATSDVAAKKPQEHELAKPGYFASEDEIVMKVRSATGTIGVRHPITYLVEAADDIVYCPVDLEDGVKKSVLDWPTVQQELKEETSDCPLLNRVLAQAARHIEPANFKGREHQEAFAQAFRIAAISEMVTAAVKTFKAKYPAIMAGDYHGEILYDPECEASALAKACKVVLRRTLYRHRDILRLEVRGRRVIHDLLDLFWEAVSEYEGQTSTRSYAGKLYLLISDNYRRVFESRLKSQTENELYCRLQLITDQVAGMTDTYACRLHKDLTNA